MDYIFTSKVQILDTESMEPDEAAHYAQKLARRYRVEVTYAEIVEYNIKPDKCQDCGEILPEDGACPVCEFNRENEPDPGSWGEYQWIKKNTFAE